MWQIHVGYNGSPKLQPSYDLFFRWLYTITTTTTITTQHHLHHHLFFLGPSFLKLNKYTLYTGTLLIHYQHYCCCMGVFNTTYSSHQPKKNRKESGGWGRGDWLPIGRLCCATKQNNKNQKQFEKIYNWSKQMVDWNIKKELSQKSKELFPRQRSSDNYEFLTGAYNPHLRASYVCMYVCVCVCVCVFHKSF